MKKRKIILLMLLFSQMPILVAASSSSAAPSPTFSTVGVSASSTYDEEDLIKIKMWLRNGDQEFFKFVKSTVRPEDTALLSVLEKYEEKLAPCWKQKEADAKHEKAEQLYLQGLRYREARDEDAMAGCFAKASELGHTDASFVLGKMYSKYTRAKLMYSNSFCRGYRKYGPWGCDRLMRKYYKRAADQGSVRAMIAYADSFTPSAFQPITDVQRHLAILYYEKAIEQGSMLAMHKLGYLYDRQGSYEKAMKCFRTAAKKGHASTCIHLLLLQEIRKEVILSSAELDEYMRVIESDPRAKNLYQRMHPGYWSSAKAVMRKYRKTVMPEAFALKCSVV